MIVRVLLLTIFRAKAQKQQLAATTATAAAAAAAAAATSAAAAAAAGDDIGIGDPLKDRRRKIANFARYLGLDPHRDGGLMWIAGVMFV